MHIMIECRSTLKFKHGYHAGTITSNLILQYYAEVHAPVCFISTVTSKAIEANFNGTKEE